MSHISLTPHACALSPHALSILRPLLRRIALAHRDLSSQAMDVDIDNSDESDDGEDVTVAQRLQALATPLQQRIDQPYAAPPAATAMTPEEIAADLVGGHDPWAEEPGTRRNNRLVRPPVQSMITASRFAALLTDADTVDALTSRRACTLIKVPQSFDFRALHDEINATLEWFTDITLPSYEAWCGFGVVALDADSKKLSNRQQDNQSQSIDYAIRSGRKILAFLPQQMPVPDTLRAACDLILTFPPVTAELCLEVLRATHSATGQVAEDHIRSILPSDADIATLPLTILERAFSAQTSIAVAQDLARAAQRLKMGSGTTLNDIVLNASVREPVRQLVADMAEWMSGKLAWAEVSSSILFVGPPGNGKTLLASALAGSVNAPLIATSYSDCQKHGHQGDMLRTLSGKVEEVIAKSPSVFFLDELDSFTHRNAPNRRGDYIVGVVNGLLEHLSRLNDTPGVIVLAATNHPDMIDPSILRPGRFDRHIKMGNPDRASIIRLLKHAIREATQSFDLHPIADQLLGSSGATVISVVREARGLARREGAALEQGHLQAATDRIAPPLDQNTLWRAAIHEAGHMVVAAALGLPPPTRASLTRQAGHVEIPTSPIETRETATRRIATLLGGFAAEIQVFGHTSNGSGNGPTSDLAVATELAGRVNFEWGLKERLTHIPFQSALQNPIAIRSTHPIEQTLQECLDMARKALETNPNQLRAIASALLMEREFSETRCREILLGIGLVDVEPEVRSPAI